MRFPRWPGADWPGILEGVLRHWLIQDKPQREPLMDALVERLDKKLREWSPETAERVRRQVAEIIELADLGLLDVARSRQVEQEVLDLLDEPAPR